MRLIRLFLALALPVAAQSVTLNWTANPANPQGTQYNVYRATGACGGTQTFTKINAAPIGPLTYRDTAIAIGATYCYRVTAVAGAIESAPSPTAQAVIPPGAPPSLTITVEIAVNVNVDGVAVASRSLAVKVPEGQ